MITVRWLTGRGRRTMVHIQHPERTGKTLCGMRIPVVHTHGDEPQHEIDECRMCRLKLGFVRRVA